MEKAQGLEKEMRRSWLEKTEIAEGMKASANAAGVSVGLPQVPNLPVLDEVWFSQTAPVRHSPHLRV